MSDLSPADTPADAAERSPALRPVPAGPDPAVEKLLERVRPWALRQAERSYGHLPERDRVVAVDGSLRALRDRGVADDLRAARVGMADDLTARLRSAHVDWCHRPSAVDAPPPATPQAPDTVQDVVERGLKGLERAVLQLEIGAGRDTRTARAALRLGPRDYSRHRREGLAKLRAAIGGQVTGHVCDAHSGDVVLAATGDDAALERLAAGPDRCRSCSREAQGLRRVLHQRLGLAPWPLTIKPMGALAAKLAGLGGAAAAGTATVAGGGSTALGGAVTGIAATVAGIAALGGGVYAVSHRSGDEPAAAAATVAKPVAAKPAATRAATAPVKRRESAPARRGAGKSTTKTKTSAPTRTTTRPAPAQTAAPASAPASTQTSRPSASAPAPSTPATPETAKPVTETVSGAADGLRGTAGGVEDAVAPVTGALPEAVATPADQTVTGVTGTVERAADVTDQLAATADDALAGVDATVAGLVAP